MRVILAIAVVGVLGAPALASEPLRISVEVPADAACPSVGTIATLVAQDTARVPAIVDRDADVEISIAAQVDGLRGELVLAHHRGRRVLHAPRDRCADLVEALTFALRMALEIEAAGPAVARQPSSPTPARQPSVASVPSSEAPPVTTITAPASGVYFARVGVHASVGAGPRVAPGVLVGGGFGRDRWSIALEGRFVTTSTESLMDDRSVSAMTWMVTLVPCSARGPLRLCGLVGAGALHGKSARRNATGFAAAGGRLGWARNVGGVNLMGHADVLVPLTPTTLRVDGDDVWQTAPAAASVGVSAQVRFP